jgi:RimJ/RimL family protein N-acetyltransferase
MTVENARTVPKDYSTLTTEAVKLDSLPLVASAGIPNRGMAPLYAPTLESLRLRLEPLTLDTFFELRRRTSAEPHLFRHLDLDVEREGALDTWLINAIKSTDSGNALHFVVRTKQDESVVGHTAIIQIRPAIRVDIAWTWIFPEHQGKGFARESKLLLYNFLFRTHSFRRVQITADSMNEASIRSITSSGATLETVMLNARVRKDGTVGHTAVFRILDTDYFGMSEPDVA